MTKMIKAAKATLPTFVKGQTINWRISSFDGRGYICDEYTGTITRVNRITVTAVDTDGNTWLVDKTDIKK